MAQSPGAMHAVPVPGRNPHLPITHESPDAHASDLLHALPGGVRGWHVVPSQKAPAAQAGWCRADAATLTRVLKGWSVQVSFAAGGFLHVPSAPTL